jgi:enamine deaminase RidA (YjgF/YER057c/UK114 family)
MQCRCRAGCPHGPNDPTTKGPTLGGRPLPRSEPVIGSTSDRDSEPVAGVPNEPGELLAALVLRQSGAIARGATLVFTAGAVPLDATGELVGADDAVARTEQVVANLLGALSCAGAGPEDVVKTTVYVAGTDHDRQATVWEAVQRSPIAAAPSTLLGADLGLPGSTRRDRSRRGPGRLTASADLEGHDSTAEHDASPNRPRASPMNRRRAWIRSQAAGYLSANFARAASDRQAQRHPRCSS